MQPTPLLQLAHRLSTGESAISAWITQSPSLGTIFAATPFDAVAYDLQHSRNGVGDVLQAIPGVVRSGKPVIVRIPANNFSLSSRFLDAGASCIIAPMISTEAQAQEFVSYCKYPPQGDRSWGPFESLPLSGLPRQQYLEEANNFSLALAMIETEEALNNLDDILQVEGLDGIFVGPTDLGISLSRGREVGETTAVNHALKQVADKCHKAGKIAGVYCLTSEFAQNAAAGGFKLLALGSDKDFIIRGGQDVLNKAKGNSAGAAQS